MRHDNFVPHPKFIQIHSRGRLPHWQIDECVYFITFRLRDSLPREVARQLFLEREQMMRGLSNTAERARLDQAFGIRLDRELDQGYGSCILREHAEIVTNALKHFDKVRYELQAWCVMPNHVHVMLHLAEGRELPRVVHSWKSYTAHAIGRGVIWQREYFDRVIRSPQEFSATTAYIRANPVKAGLVKWNWVG